MARKLQVDQIEIDSTYFEAGGVGDRQASLKDSSITESNLKFHWETVDILASSFVHSGGLSTYDVSAEGVESSQDNVVEFHELMRNGQTLAEQVASPDEAGEWKLSAGTLTVYGDITASGDTYQIRYLVGTGGGATSSFMTTETNSVLLQANGANYETINHARNNQFPGATGMFKPGLVWINAESVLTIVYYDADNIHLYNDSGTDIAIGDAKLTILG